MDKITNMVGYLTSLLPFVVLIIAMLWASASLMVATLAALGFFNKKTKSK